MKIRKVDWYPDEWLAGTIILTPEKRGVYDAIINLVYSRGGPIVLTAGWPKLFNCHGNLLKACLRRLESLGKNPRNGTEITVKRCANELERTGNRLTKARENGQKGGRPPKENNDLGKPDGFSPGKPNEKLTSQGLCP